MSYQFQFAQHAEKDFSKLPQITQKRILDKLKYFEMSENPFAFAEKLKGLSDYYRFRIGNYRVIFTFRHEKIATILLI